MKQWVTKHELRPDDWRYSSCDELSFGTPAAPTLLCADESAFWTDPATGINTRIEMKRDLVLVTVRGHGRRELLRLPLAVGDDNLEDVIFTATYRVDEAAGTLDLEAPKADCDAASNRLEAYQNQKMQELRDNPQIGPDALKPILNAERHAAPQDLKRIKAICAAAGHYVRGAGGTLSRH